MIGTPREVIADRSWKGSCRSHRGVWRAPSASGAVHESQYGDRLGAHNLGVPGDRVPECSLDQRQMQVEIADGKQLREEVEL